MANNENLAENAGYADSLKNILQLRHEPVAVKLVKEDEDFPSGYSIPEKQLSYCQSVMQARHGSKFMMPPDAHLCNVGASSLGMMKTPEKVASGEFHFAVGIHDSADAAKKMIAESSAVPFKTKGTVVCPLKDANFKPDVVIFVDIPERIYWFEPLFTSKNGGNVKYVTAPFQAACVDVTATPVCTQAPNISIGCFGCRKRTDLKPDELLMGIPGKLIPEMVNTLKRYVTDVFPKANRS